MLDDLKSQDDKEYKKILLQDLDRSKEERKETNQKVAYIKELLDDIDYIKMSTESSKEPVTTIGEAALIFLSNMQKIINKL